LFSSLQSLLFNRVLEKREAAGTWATVLAGDVAKKRDSGGLFTVPAEGPELEDARARACAGALCATGPMFGARMRWPEGEPLAIEREALAGVGGEVRLDAFRHLGEGTRRPLRLFVEGMSVEVRAVEPQSTGRAVVVARFVLPKGGYATTVLGRACRLVDMMARSPAASGTEPEAPHERSPTTGDLAPEP
jgi:tRNA pseudouridine13 synthase